MAKRTMFLAMAAVLLIMIGCGTEESIPPMAGTPIPYDAGPLVSATMPEGFVVAIDKRPRAIRLENPALAVEVMVFTATPGGFEIALDLEREKMIEQTMFSSNGLTWTWRFSDKPPQVGFAAEASNKSGDVFVSGRGLWDKNKVKSFLAAIKGVEEQR